MKEIDIGLGWFGFWVFLAVVYYVSHIQFMAGYENPFFGWKTDEEKALRKAAIEKAGAKLPQIEGDQP